MLLKLRTHVALALGVLAGCTYGPQDDPRQTIQGSIAAETPKGDRSIDGGATAAHASTAFEPAFAPFVPALLNQGGPSLDSPEIITVIWEEDPNAALWESVGDDLGVSTYWRTVVGEYGVGAAHAGGHVELPSSQEPIRTDELPDFLASVLSDPSSGFPEPTAQSLYVFFAPEGKIVDSTGAGCNGEFGYHATAMLEGREVPFAVIFECPLPSGLDTQQITATASHEIAEVALDPFSVSNQAWIGIDDEHLAFDLLFAFQNENGDLCEFFPEQELAHPEPSLRFSVQRQWSNASAAAGHNPCVPVPPEPYFNVSALGLDAVTVDLTALVTDGFAPETRAGTTQTRALRVPVGGEGSVELGLFSDGPTDAWSLEAYEMDPEGPRSDDDPFPRAPTPSVAVQLDKNTGKNGDRVTLTARALASTPLGGSLVVVTSTLGASRHFFPIIVGGE